MRCPECTNGKHVNCTGWAFNRRTDELEDCGCNNDHCRNGTGR